MPLQKQGINISFGQGLDTKSDPFQVQPGNFLELENSVFSKFKQLTKRNGYGPVASLPTNTKSQVITTFEDNLTAIGTNIYALIDSTQQWVNKGQFKPVDLSTISLVKNSFNQTQADSVISPNNLICTVYTDLVPNSTGTNVRYHKYVITDAITGQNIVNPTNLVTNNSLYGSPKVFVLGYYFVIVYTNTDPISGGNNLNYIGINYTSPSSAATTPITIAASYSPTTTVSWDAVSYSNKLFVAYNTASGGQSVKITYINSTLGAPISPAVFSNEIASIMNVTADSVTNDIWATWYDSTNKKVKAVAVNTNLQTIGILPFTGTLASGNNTITGISSTAGAAIGMRISAVGIPANTLITNVTSTTIVMSNNATASGATSILVYTDVITGGTSNGINQITTTSSVSGIAVGTTVIGPNIPVNTTVTNVATGSPNIITLSNNATATASSQVFAFFLNPFTIATFASAPTTAPQNIAGSAYNGTLNLYVEVSNTYAYNSLPTNYINKYSCDNNGFVTYVGASPLVRSVGLASKAFRIDSTDYFLAAFTSSYQPTFFLLNGSGTIISRLAYQSGGGYLTTGIPNVSVIDSVASVCYLYKDVITPVNKNTNVPSGTQIAGIYAQLGVNLVSFDFSTSAIRTSEIGANLNLTGGFVAAYDGTQITEQGFFLYPSTLGVTNPVNLTPTGNITSGSNLITSVSSMSNIVIGMNVGNANFPGSTAVITAISGSTITVSKNATGNATGATLTITGNMTNQPYYYVATYEWSDNQGNLFRSAPAIPVTITTSSTGKFTVVNVPTLRLTYKTINPVKIVLYRWSQAQQVYYQVTSTLTPVSNDLTVDYVSIVDILTDAEILGNSILYTTGGVLENVAPPASSLMTLFNNRLWILDAEDRNLLWFSKPVLQATPVEMSDLLTTYVAPTTASQGSTGHITALSPMDDKLVIFKRNAIGYINGQGPDAAGNYNQYSEFVLVNAVVGCDQPQSIVLTPNGLMFQSGSGIWLLGRDLSTQYIGSPVEGYTQDATVLSAVNVPGTTQVRFTLDSGVTLMYDYFFQQWGSFSNIPGIYSTIYQNLHTYLTEAHTYPDGTVVQTIFQETPGQYLDNTAPVLMKFKTAWMNFAGVQGFERFYEMYLLGKYLTPFKLNVELAYNYNSTPSQATVVSPQEYGGAWGDVGLWGGGNTWGNTPDGKVFEARLFPQVQKCESFQITMTELYDSTYSTTPGAGLTLSGMNLVVGMKKGYRTSTAAKSFG